MLQFASVLRDRLLRALTLFGIAIVLITEALGAFQGIRPVPLAVCWIVAAIAGAFYCRRHRTLAPFTFPHFDPLVAFSLVCTAAILILTAIVAAYSPPNSADAMAYHMPRVVYWAEQGSVRFFPTAYFNQIMLQPAAEFLMLHLYVLMGNDRLVNFVQWIACLGSIVGVSSVAGLLGASPRGQALAAVFCATLPSGILASSGAKNDYWLAMWLVSAVYFALRFMATHRRTDTVFFGACFGLALLTKGTAYLFVPFVVGALFLTRERQSLRKLAPGIVIAGVVAFALNLPHYVRNYNLSHSILGFDSAQGDGVYRWRNETFGWKPTVSNILRNGSEQLGARSAQWNQRVYEFVAAAHQRLGIELNDPGTTWRGETYRPPRNANHEADANSRWHLALLAILVIWLAIRRVEVSGLLYALALFAAFVAFCAYLKWQPFQARLLLPLFVLAAPLMGTIRLPALLQLAVCVFLIDNARLPLLENWVRPLRGPKSVLTVPRDAQYFADMTPWNNQATYRKTVDMLAGMDCRTIGIDITNFQLEYPLQALVRERMPDSVFVHTGVENASARYPPAVSAPPCAVVCLDCIDDAKRLAEYSDFSASTTMDRFVIFTKPAKSYR